MVRAAMRIVLLGLLVAGACGQSDSGGSPAETLRQFLTVMDESAADETALQRAYSLLDSDAQTALTERAKHARALSGQAFEPWQMLAQGRFRLRFAPARSRGMRERVQGDHAVVTVVSGDGSDRADVPLVREEGQWRVALAIPPRESR
jgi:aryl-alcohol dehydrogenase-like predicted oxidoreductase